MPSEIAGDQPGGGRGGRVDLAVFLASLADGGVGKMRVHLVNEFVRRGLRVELVLGHTDGRYLDQLSPNVRVVDLGTSHAVTALPRLVRYLRQQRPRALLTQRVRVNVAGLRANWLAGRVSRVYSTLNTNLTRQLDSMSPRKAAKQRRWLRRYYPRNDGLIAISRGVADDAAPIIGVAREAIDIAPNPVVTEQLFAMASEPVEHPWLQDDGPPVILGVGRLAPQKDFPTLVRAFEQVRAQRPARLLILGEGRERGALEAQAAAAGIGDDVDLPGFVNNPYAYIARASVFALSSRWEGFGNALAESVALGCPVVSTDCPSGPSEILDNGQLAPLVAVGDWHGLGAEILRLLERPPKREPLRRAGATYTVEHSANRYLAAMRLA